MHGPDGNALATNCVDHLPESPRTRSREGGKPRRHERRFANILLTDGVPRGGIHGRRGRQQDIRARIERKFGPRGSPWTCWNALTAFLNRAPRFESGQGYPRKAVGIGCCLLPRIDERPVQRAYCRFMEESWQNSSVVTNPDAGVQP